MIRKLRLLHIIAFLLVILALVSVTTKITTPLANAQTAVTPTLYCLGGCPTVAVSSSVSTNPSSSVSNAPSGGTSVAQTSPSTTSTTPSANSSSTPCKTITTSHENEGHHHHHHKGGFLEAFFKFFLQLLMWLLGGTPPCFSSPSTTTTPSPSSGVTASTAPSTAPSASVSTATTPASTPASGTVNDCGNKPRVKADCNAANVVCINSDSTSVLTITKSNTIYEGNCHKVGGIRGEGVDNVTVQGFNSYQAPGTGIWLKGKNDTIRDNTITQVKYAGDDIDAMRFFGNGFKIINNKSTDVLFGTDEHGAHLDCMQTYATTSAGGGSSNVTIQDNYCDNSHFHQCVMAEGPQSTDGGGGGGGVSQNWTISNNHFACHADQTIKLDDIDNGTIEGNDFSGTGTRAIYITPLSTGWTVKNNTLGSGYSSLQ